MKSRVLRWLVCLPLSSLAALILIMTFGILLGTEDTSAVPEAGRSIIFSKKYVIVGLAQLLSGGIFAYILRGRVITGGLVFGMLSGLLTGSVMVSLMALVDYGSLQLYLARVMYTMLGVCMAYGVAGGLAGSWLYRLTHRSE